MAFSNRRFFLIATVIAAAAASAASTSDVINLTPSNFDDVVLGSGKMTLVRFYLAYSGHCKLFGPKFEDLATLFRPVNDEIQFAQLDLYRYPEIIDQIMPNADEDTKRHGVIVASLRLFTGSLYQHSDFDYGGSYSLDDVAAKIKVQTGLSPKRDVLTLTDRTFAAAIGGPKHVIVAYTSSRCKLLTWTCTTLRPLWETLGANMILNLPRDVRRNLIIAEVDTDDPRSQMISAIVPKYPIKWYAAGSKTSENYLGRGTLRGLLKFISDRAAYPERIESMDKNVGTLSELDALLTKVANGDMMVDSALHEIGIQYKCMRWEYAFPLPVRIYSDIAGDLLELNPQERYDYISTARQMQEGLVLSGDNTFFWTPGIKDYHIQRLNILNRFAAAFGMSDYE